MPRVPRVLAHVALGGTAWLVTPRGEVCMSSGPAIEVARAARILRIVHRLSDAERVACFADGDTSVHVAPVCDGWVLCVVVPADIPRVALFERARKACRVLAIALGGGDAFDAGAGGAGGSGAPAQAGPARTAVERAGG